MVMACFASYFVSGSAVSLVAFGEGDRLGKLDELAAGARLAFKSSIKPRILTLSLSLLSAVLGSDALDAVVEGGVETAACTCSAYQVCPRIIISSIHFWGYLDAIWTARLILHNSC